MLVEVLAAWITFILIVGVIHDIIKLIVYSILGLLILMWWAVTTLLFFIYNCVYSLFSGVGNLANNIVWTIYRPIQARGSTLHQFFTLGFGVITLVLGLVHYTITLWLFCYVIILLYHFIQRLDFAIQGNFYFGLSPGRNHFRGQGQTLTIAPVLLDNCKQ